MSSTARTDVFATRPQLKALLDELHACSLSQERQTAAAAFPASTDAKDLAQFADKLVALDQDKAQAMYLLLRATNAQRIFEAGTSFGVSTMYLIAAMRDNVRQNGVRLSAAKVWGTENEPDKVEKALTNIQQAYAPNGEWTDIVKQDQFEILQGDIVASIQAQSFDAASIDALLLDIWAPVALPTLESLDNALRPGAVVLIDNSRPGATRYAELHAYLDDAGNGWRTVVLPFHNGFEMAVKV